MSPAGTRVIFMGSPAFAVPSLRALLEAGYDVCAAVTQPDRPAGRGGKLAQPEVKQAALAAGVPVLQPESLKDPAVQAELAAFAPDLLVVAAYGKILPRAVLAIPKHGPLNVHASLLPRWRGASPIAAAILAGDADTGVTIMEMAPKMDAGGIIAQARTPIAADDTTRSMEEWLSGLGARLLIETLPGWLAGDLRAAPQEKSLVTFCGLVKKEDGHLRAEMTATEAERAVRAFDPWPGAFVGYKGARLAIWKASVAPFEGAISLPGTLRVFGRTPAIAFEDGWLVLEEVQRTGAKRMAADQFVNGERGALEDEVALA